MSTYFPVISNGGQLKDLYRLTKAHGLLTMTFHGKVRSMKDFTSALDGAYIYGIEQEAEIVGFSWLNNWTGRAAAVHVCLWPTAKGRLTLGREFVEHVLSQKTVSGKPWLDALYGPIPESFTHAIAFALSVGLKDVGTIPCGVELGGKVENLRLFAITRAEIEEEI